MVKARFERKKRNKNGISFQKTGKQTAKCVVMVLVGFGAGLLGRLGDVRPPLPGSPADRASLVPKPEMEP